MRFLTLLFANSYEGFILLKKVKKNPVGRSGIHESIMGVSFEGVDREL